MKSKSDSYLNDNSHSKTTSITYFFKKIILRTESRSRSDEVEKRKNIKPSFVAFFYYYLFLHKRIPSQSQYTKFYLDLNINWVNQEFDTNSITYLLGRIARFYPSMLRDYHFYHLLKESEFFEEVRYSLEEDIFSKNDILVKRNGEWYGLQMRTLTNNSTYFYNKKENRNFKQSYVKSIDFPIHLSNEATPIQTKGEELLLYNMSHVRKAISLIDTYNQEKTTISS